MSNTTEPCQLCGKPVNVKRPHYMIRVLTDDLGWFPIGPECRKAVFPHTVRDGLVYGNVERWPGN
jgi:hypothetical protein